MRLDRLSSLGTCWAVLLAGLALATVPSTARAQSLRPSFDLRRVLFARPHRPPPLSPPHRPDLMQEDYDVLHYDLSLFLDTREERIEGHCVVTFRPAPGVTDLRLIELDLHDGSLDVLEVTRAGNAVTWEHAENLLTIPLDPPVGSMEEAVVEVTYAGRPRELPFGTLTFTAQGEPPVPLVYTLSEPFLARGWWPCKDRPDDKATVTLHVEAPDDLTVVANGTLVSREPSPLRPEHLITTWRERHPISTYLVSIAATVYESWTETYTSRTGMQEMPVTFWSWPVLTEEARSEWEPTLPILRFFADAFVEYPFLDEKYGHAMVELIGAVEHQTVASWGAAVTPGNGTYEWLVAHELAHQWWGDHVGPSDFDSVWLNEGFATYAEALWEEAKLGRGAYLEYVEDLDVRTWRPGSEFLGTVHDPVDEDLDGWPDADAIPTVYAKGAWILHMLRWVLAQPGVEGDAAPLLELLREHAARHGEATASTADFVALAAELSVGNPHAPLDAWFFPQWLSRDDRPLYEVGWSAAPEAGGGAVVHLRVTQVQEGAPYAMPVLVRMQGAAGATVHEEVVWSESRVEDHAFPVDVVPTEVIWDPDGWVLKDVTPVDIDRDDDGWPDWLDGCPRVPNPEQEDRDGDGRQDACQPGLDFDGDGVPNEQDCAPADADSWSEAERDVDLRVRREPDGAVILSFDVPAAGEQRPYATHLAAGFLSALRSTESLESATCLVDGWTEPEWTDPLPTVPGGTFYLAFPFNGCTEPPPVTFGDDPCR